MKDHSMTRRTFLGATATLATLAALPRQSTAAPGAPSANSKLNIAGIGIGGMGAGNLRNLESENIVALCDVDPDYAAKTIQRYPKAKVYTDYREMLEKQKDIDAVLIATPDHTHAVISLAAMKAGKHVYCQKPLCHDIHEARVLAQASRDCKVVTQMGIQGHSGEGFRSVCEWIASGAIGEVREVDAWCSLSYYPWGHASWSSKWGVRPTDTPAVPQQLNWDLWLGPAPRRPYHPAYHPRTWRCWWDFGNGMMGDRGAHTLDPVFAALKLGLPASIEATSCGNNAETHPLSAIVTFQFPARNGLPPVKLNWYEGTRPPLPAGIQSHEDIGEKEGGVVFKGGKGMLTCGVYGNSPRLVPESAAKAFAPPARTLPRVKGTHELDWVEAIKNGRQAGANFEYSGPLTEICVLGNIAIRVDARIEYDAAAMKITNLPEASKYVQCEYRKGWEI